MILVYRQTHRQTGETTVYSLDLSLEAQILGADSVRQLTAKTIPAWSNATYKFEVAS